jgi:hypothetical protein
MATIELFYDKYPNFDPNFVSQGNIGDCWLISVLFSLSINEKGKHILRNSFNINNNGTYTIKLLNEKRINQYITIPCKFKVDQTNQLKYAGYSLNIPQLFNTNPSNEYIWASIFEKAISKYTGCIKKLDGNYAINAFKLLCNNNVELCYNYGINKRFLDRFFTMFKTSNIACVLEFSNSTDKDIIPNHAYTLYDIDKDNNNIWYIYNPHKQFIDIESCDKVNMLNIKNSLDVITYIKL